MARAIDHIHLANKNHAALLHNFKELDAIPEWVTTIAFYKAVQIVDAMCVVYRGHCPTGHPNRFEWVQRTPVLEPLYKPFRSLHSASCIARYLSDTFDKSNKLTFSSFSDYLSADDVFNKMVKGRLVSIEQYSLSKLPDQLKKLLLRIDGVSRPNREPSSGGMALPSSNSIAASPP